MKCRHLFFYVQAFGILLGACTEPSIKQGCELNLEVAMKMEKRILLSELSDSLECVFLETNDSSLLGNRAYLLYANRENLFIKSGNVVYRFDQEGRFLNKIGQRGNAPEEYNSIHSASIDEDNERLLFYVGQKKVQFWGYDGSFQEEIYLQIESEITFTNLLNKGKIIAEGRRYLDAGLETYIYTFDLNGKLLKEIPMGGDALKVNLSMHTSPLMYLKDDGVRYKDINTNFLYSFCEDSIERQWNFNLGTYSPSRELLEDVTQRETLMRDFAQLVDIQESNKRFYFLIVHNNELRGMVVDKKTGRLEYSQVMEIPQKGGGIENDYIDKSCFWPSFICDSDVMYCLLPIEKVTDVGRKDVERHSLRNRQLYEDLNPIVLKAHEK